MADSFVTSVFSNYSLRLQYIMNKPKFRDNMRLVNSQLFDVMSVL